MSFFLVLGRLLLFLKGDSSEGETSLLSNSLLKRGQREEPLQVLITNFTCQEDD